LLFWRRPSRGEIDDAKTICAHWIVEMPAVVRNLHLRGKVPTRRIPQAFTIAFAFCCEF